MKASEQYDHISKGGKKPPKKISDMHIKATDNGKHVVTHHHHHPEHHPSETHAVDDLAQHVTDNAPNMAAQAPPMEAPEPAAGPAGAAPMGMMSPAGM